MRNTRKGFTLIELMIVIAIIAIIAAIAIPGILSARRSANAGSALANLKSFSTAMATYAQDQSDQKYPASSAALGDYYSHIETKGGYKYFYKTNSGNSKFVYVTAPASLNNGTKIYFVDESNRIFEADATTEANCTGINNTATFDFNEEGSARYTSLNWKAKS
ncbi:MAG: prepilin-type N-terminal cleavage/methylation domain-containing protein [Candidatus Brocadiae bacterium]|nr:prepilin-type N-terminal cleavage/methylation domain-containing protein [Candidatus Brocadiia bacterium]